MPLSSGSRLGPYEIVAAVGAGGMGTVYRARDTRLDRTVAIKVSAEEFGERFEREARAIAQFNHPHICQLYDVGPNYLVMEYVEGTPLAGPMPAARAVALAVEVLDAIEAAHRRGITHRDLKPANILVTPQGVKLLDFGLAKATSPIAGHDEQTMRAVTAAGQIVGTLQYMAPEQLQGKPTDARSDLFSFGCVFYEMLTGKRAFDGGDPASVIATVLTREAPSVSDVAPGLERIVRRALAKDPEQRFQTAGDLKAALLWAMEQPAPPPPPRQHWWKFGAAAALGAAVAGALAFVTFGSSAVPLNVAVDRFEILAPQNGRFVFGINTGGIALSPDARTLAFVASVEGRNALWVRRFDESGARLLAGTDGAASPFWSPDGRSIGFTAGTTLKRVDVDGGSPTPICDISSVRGALWMPSGDILFGTNATGLQRVAASGGTPQPVTTLDQANEGFHGFPQLLDADNVAYFVRATRPERSGMYLISLAAPDARRLLVQAEANSLVAARPDGSRFLLWPRGGTLMAQRFNARTLTLDGEARPAGDVGFWGPGTSQINATTAGDMIVLGADAVVSQLTWFDREGMPSGTLGEPDDINSFDLSPGGQDVAVSLERDGGAALWVMDLGRGGIPIRLNTASRSLQPVWSPNGTQIAFGAGGVANIFRKAIDGGQPEQRLTNAVRTQMPLDWSRDGAHLLIFEVGSPTTARDLLTLTPAATEPVTATPYLHERHNEWWAKFRPTSPPQWVAFQSDESDQWEVFIDSFPTPGHRKRVSTAGGQYPQWAPDGHELFYVAGDATLMRVPLMFEREQVIPGTPQPLFRLPVVDTGRHPYDVSPDGKRFLVRAVAPEMGRTLTAIVNWPELLSAR